MTKEQLIREALDWAARSEHESQRAFREGDLWAGIAWGEKVSHLNQLVEDARLLPFEDSGQVWTLAGTVEWIVERLDPADRLLRVFFAG